MAKTSDRMGTDAKPGRRRITKRELAKRDLRFIDKLAAGATIEEIAASEGISAKWARERKRAILADRAIDPPHEFIQLQIRRMNKAMLFAYGAMSIGNLKAIDQVIKVVRELDRYHGFGPSPSTLRFAAPTRVDPPPFALPEPPPALAPPEASEATTDGAANEPRDSAPSEDNAAAE